MATTASTAIAVIGIDIGKNSFHIVGLDDRGAIVLRQKWSRGQVEIRLANMPPWRRLDERIEALSGEIEELAKRDAGCERLMSVPGIGPIISSAMVAAIGTGDGFAKGREAMGQAAEVVAPSSLDQPMEMPRGVQVNDLSRSVVAFEHRQ
jgi:transposase